jgi:hypothetical protein
MTPTTLTIYTVCLFLALAALLIWAKRRQRNGDAPRRSATELQRTPGD